MNAIKHLNMLQLTYFNVGFVALFKPNTKVSPFSKVFLLQLR